MLFSFSFVATTTPLSLFSFSGMFCCCRGSERKASKDDPCRNISRVELTEETCVSIQMIVRFIYDDSFLWTESSNFIVSFNDKDDSFHVVNTILFFESFVEETMDSTDVGRKSLNDYSLSEKHSLPANNTNTLKMVKNQHCTWV